MQPLLIAKLIVLMSVATGTPVLLKRLIPKGAVWGELAGDERLI
jgi:hypothetical protein